MEMRLRMEKLGSRLPQQLWIISILEEMLVIVMNLMIKSVWSGQPKTSVLRRCQPLLIK
uniref:Uncharacterized protein n=1 Tax=Populus trichocarpa TaxID=3694 RepID=A9PA95_POPTR|nr:unknown [Populus trichocarpa]